MGDYAPESSDDEDEPTSVTQPVAWDGAGIDFGALEERFEKHVKGVAAFHPTGDAARDFDAYVAFEGALADEVKQLRDDDGDLAHPLKAAVCDRRSLRRYAHRLLRALTNGEALGLDGEAAAAGRPLMIASEELFRSPAKPSIARASALPNARAFVVCELRLPAAFVDRVECVECVAEQILGDGVLRNARVRADVAPVDEWVPVGERGDVFVGTATIPALPAGGWDVTWRVGARGQSAGTPVAWSSSSGGAFVDVEDPQRAEKERAARGGTTVLLSTSLQHGGGLL